jgi:hypothetical protein
MRGVSPSCAPTTASLPDLAHRRFAANQWTERAGHWLPPGAWSACAGEPDFTDGERIVVGVDIGGERSDSAVVWLTIASTSASRC